MHLLLYIASFFVIWIGAGLIIRSVDTFAKKLRISSFATSFFILGILTSIPELSVGINAIAERDPEIFVGNLLGGVIVIFLFIIPLLAILGNGIKLTKQLDKKNLILSLVIIASPSFFMADKHISNFDGIFMVLLYLLLLFFIEKKEGLMDMVNKKVHKQKINQVTLLLKIIGGVMIVYFSSDFIVSQTLYFSEQLKVSPFYISLLALSIGTNLPELSLAIRSVFTGKKDIAFGDYVGSAAANTLLFGILSLFYQGEVHINGNFYITFFFIVLGLGAFYLFSRSKNTISRSEGLILLGLYVVFVIIELSKTRLGY